MYQKCKVTIVVAIGNNRELGNQNGLLWHIPQDMRRFRSLTQGHPIIMGRKTFESILLVLGKPLPGRTNIVISRSPEAIPSYENVKAVTSLEDGLRIAQDGPGGDEIHIGGGAQIYEQALPFVDTLHLTLVHDSPPADTFFPPYEDMFTKITSEEHHTEGEIEYRWVTMER